MYLIPVLLLLFLLGSHLYLRGRRRPLRLRQEVPVVDLRPRGMARRTTVRSWGATALASTQAPTRASWQLDPTTTLFGHAVHSYEFAAPQVAFTRDALIVVPAAQARGSTSAKQDFGPSAPAAGDAR